MMRTTWPMAVALLCGAGAAGAQGTAATARPCLTPAEAETLARAIAPDAIRAVGQACATSLPATALVRRTDGAFLAGYQAEADKAWPNALSIVGKVVGPNAAPFLTAETLRPMMAAVIVAGVVGKMKPADCAPIDRVVTLMAPLPPRNAAALAVTLLELSRDRRPNAPDPLPICRTAVK